MSDPHAAPQATRTFSVGPRGEGERTYVLAVDGDTTSVVPLPPEGRLLVGRGTEAELRLQDPAVSRRHAELTVEDGQVWVGLGP